MSQVNLFQTGETLINNEINIRKEKILRPKDTPTKIELILRDWGRKLTLDFILQGSNKIQNINVFYDKPKAKKEYRNAWTKLQKGEYELELSYTGDTKIIFK